MSATTNNTASYPLHNLITHQQRLECFCHYRINPNNPFYFATFPGNLRDYIDELFKLWQYLNRKIIHALDVIGFDYYTIPNTLFSTQGWPAFVALVIEKYTNTSSNMASQKNIHSSIQVGGPTLYFYSMCNKKALLIVIATLLTTHHKVWAIKQSFNKTHLII